MSVNGICDKLSLEAFPAEQAAPHQLHVLVIVSSLRDAKLLKSFEEELLRSSSLLLLLASGDGLELLLGLLQLRHEL